MPRWCIVKQRNHEHPFLSYKPESCDVGGDLERLPSIVPLVLVGIKNPHGQLAVAEKWEGGRGESISS